MVPFISSLSMSVVNEVIFSQVALEMHPCKLCCFLKGLCYSLLFSPIKQRSGF